MPYLFFHPPRRPGMPPVDFGAGPNSGPDCRESVGWMIRLVLPNGFDGSARFSRKGSDYGPCISSRCGLCTFEPLPPPLAFSAELTVFFFMALTGRLAASPYFFVPA